MAIVITDVRTILLKARRKQPLRNAFGLIEYRTAMIVEITTSEGITGYGETWVSFPAGWPTTEAR